MSRSERRLQLSKQQDRVQDAMTLKTCKATEGTKKVVMANTGSTAFATVLNRRNDSVRGQHRHYETRAIRRITLPTL